MLPAASSASAMAVSLSSSLSTNFFKPVAAALSSLFHRLQSRYRSYRNTGPKRRFWMLLTGAVLSVALIIIGGFLVARTLMMGEPPWKAPQARALPDPVLLAAAAKRMEPLPDEAPQTGAAPLPETGKKTAPAELPPSTNTIPAADAASPASASTERPASESMASQLPAASASEPSTAPSADAERRTALRAADVERPAAPARHGSPLAARPGAVPVNGASSGASDGPPMAMAENDDSEAIGRALLPEQNKTRKPLPPPVRNEPRPARVAQAPGQQNWYVAMKSQLNRCADDPNVFSRVICAEQAKFRYCSPNRWGQVAECVKTQYRDISTINEKSGRGIAFSRHDRTG